MTARRLRISIFTKIQLYHVYIQPILLCGFETWASKRKTGSLPLTASASNVFFGFRTRIMLQMLMYDFEPSVHHICSCSSRRRFRFFGHGARMSVMQDTFRDLHTSIRRFPKDWKHCPGCSRHTWLCTIEADLEPLSMDWIQYVGFEDHGGSS